MDEAGTRVGRDEIAREQRARLSEKAAKRVHRVTRDGASEVFASAFPKNSCSPAGFCEVDGIQSFLEIRNQIFSDQENALILVA
jgi:hypothetical protein